MLLPRRRVIREARRGSKPALEYWGARLARIRDLGLVAFGFVYAFGYLARALHAWDNNLGVLPGLEFQYFVAGLLLLIPPAAVLALFWGLWRATQAFARWEAKAPQRRAHVDNLLGAMVLLGMMLVLVGDIEWVKERWPRTFDVAITLFVGSFLANVVLAMARPESPRPATDAGDEGGVRRKGVLARLSRVLDAIGRASGALLIVDLGLAVILLLLAAMLLGAAKLLPLMPQALGGGAPRCAQFELERSRMSVGLAALLADKDAKDASARTMRARPVLVYYSGGDAVLFKLPEAARSGQPAYELRRAAISAITWCRDIK